MIPLLRGVRPREARAAFATASNDLYSGYRHFDSRSFDGLARCDLRARASVWQRITAVAGVQEKIRNYAQPVSLSKDCAHSCYLLLLPGNSLYRLRVAHMSHSLPTRLSERAAARASSRPGAGVPLLTASVAVVAAPAGSAPTSTNLPEWGACRSKQYGNTTAVRNRRRLILLTISPDRDGLCSRRREFIHSWGSEFRSGAHGFSSARGNEESSLFAAIAQRRW